MAPNYYDMQVATPSGLASWSNVAPPLGDRFVLCEKNYYYKVTTKTCESSMSGVEYYIPSDFNAFGLQISYPGTDVFVTFWTIINPSAMG